MIKRSDQLDKILETQSKEQRKIKLVKMNPEFFAYCHHKLNFDIEIKAETITIAGIELIISNETETYKFCF